jgi:hypothetical protein
VECSPAGGAPCEAALGRRIFDMVRLDGGGHNLATVECSLVGGAPW